MILNPKRQMKVYETSGYKYNSVPQIRMQGKWLEELGFTQGTPINIECQGGRLIITCCDQYICDLDGNVIKVRFFDK